MAGGLPWYDRAWKKQDSLRSRVVRWVRWLRCPADPADPPDPTDPSPYRSSPHLLPQEVPIVECGLLGRCGGLLHFSSLCRKKWGWKHLVEKALRVSYPSAAAAPAETDLPMGRWYRRRHWGTHLRHDVHPRTTTDRGTKPGAPRPATSARLLAATQRIAIYECAIAPPPPEGLHVRRGLPKPDCALRISVHFLSHSSRTHQSCVACCCLERPPRDG